MTDLGMCGAGYCDAPAVVYVSRQEPGRTGARLVVIAGDRARQLAVVGTAADNVRCVDHAHDELDGLIALERTHGASGRSGLPL